MNPELAYPEDLYSSAGARGLYNPLHFVVRLDKDLNEALQSCPSGLVGPSEGSFELFSAFGTYLHETIHWWQHIGSTTGLMLSFAQPSQSHINHADLLRLLDSLGPFKSLRTFLLKNSGRLKSDSENTLNKALNNWHDIEFNKRIILDPDRISESVTGNPFFESVGHSLEIGLASMLALLSSTFDRKQQFLPDPRRWESGFADLRKRKVRGYYHGSPIHIVPLGAKKIFEGQARFSQLQYLHFASGGGFGWDEFRKLGMFGEVYVAAFQNFLTWAKLDWPSSVLSPTVSLFLLVCDLAINPSNGYPFDLVHLEPFIESNDPSMRFMCFASHIAKNPELKTAIRNHSRNEYLEVASELCSSMRCKTPVEIAQRVISWGEQSSLQCLLTEDSVSEFKNENLPVRVLFAKHLRYMEDRVKKPEFFCWPAIYLTQNSQIEGDPLRMLELFERHQAPFFAEIGGEIRPTLFGNKDEAKTHQIFTDFYGCNVVYDLVNQWTINDGPFDFDYSWLTPMHSSGQVKSWVGKRFEDVFKVSLDEFRFYE